MESKKLPSWLTRRRRGLGSRWPAAARTWVARGKLLSASGRQHGGTDESALRSAGLAWRQMVMAAAGATRGWFGTATAQQLQRCREKNTEQQPSTVVMLSAKGTRRCCPRKPRVDESYDWRDF
ncbi:hypothetical protein NL676_032738 [Syzygium grande]|nr:hypothetical protein NL676_032738 [Syzygium grande]